MRAQIKEMTELAVMSRAEVSAEIRRLDGLIEARREAINQLQIQIRRLSEGWRAAADELRRRG